MAVRTEIVSRPRRVAKGLLTVGFLGLAGGILLAHASPAHHYELSIYAGTPLGFWLLGGLALAISMVVTLTVPGGRLRALALVLLGGTILAVAALPLVRSYFFFGGSDSLTHLGWVKDLSKGTLTPVGLLYPAIHLVAISLGELAGIQFRRSLMFVPLAIALVFFLFVTLTVRELLSGYYEALFVGLVSGLMLLPITNISTQLAPHPISQAIMFSPVFLYLGLRYVTSPVEEPRYYNPTPLGVLLAVFSVAIVLYHPQQAVNVLLLFVAICALQIGARTLWTDSTISEHRPAYAQTAFLGVVFLAWTSGRPRAESAIIDRIIALFRFLLGQSSITPAVASQADSASSAGASVLELFAKLFLVNAVYSVLAGLLIAASLFGYVASKRIDSKIRYLAAGFVPIAFLFWVSFIDRQPTTIAFRYFGYIMVLATVLGAALLREVLARGTTGELPAKVTGSSVVLFALLLLLSVGVIFPSPYILHPSPHVTEMKMSGHETAFSHQAGDTIFSGIRSGPERYSHAVDGKVAGVHSSRSTGVPGSVLEEGVVGYYGSDRYLIVTRSDQMRELGAYNSLRYTRESFRAVRSEPGIHRVQDNGEFRLYLVEGTTDGG